jgi:hypothetical protein
MVRRAISGAVVAALISLASIVLAPTAGAATTRQLVMSQSGAFAVLGHWCGGIHEQVYAKGFASNGYPTGDAYLSTTCSTGGRGSKPVTYTTWATVTWSWFGETRNFGKLEGPPEVSETFSATDAYGDRIYNVGKAAYLETTSPPIVAPAAPTGVTAAVYATETPEAKVVMHLQVSWVPASETAGLITSSTVTAKPVGSPAPVVTATVNGSGSYALVGPVEPSTRYSVTVTNTDAEGSSQPSTPIEVTTPNTDGEAPKEIPVPPDFGRCVKVTAGTGEYTAAGCLVESATHTGSYEWHPGVIKTGFTTAIAPATTATLETVNKAKVTCTGESSSGSITGSKTVGSTVVKFTGCQSSGAKCTSAGSAEGELETKQLEGVLGVEKITEAAGRETVHVALDVYPVGKAGPFLEYACSGGSPTTLSGSVIVPVSSGKMLKAMALKYAATAGVQKPQSFEGVPPDVLTNSLFEGVGLTLTTTQTNEEPVEMNPVV